MKVEWNNLRQCKMCSCCSSRAKMPPTCSYSHSVNVLSDEVSICMTCALLSICLSMERARIPAIVRTAAINGIVRLFSDHWWMWNCIIVCANGNVISSTHSKLFELFIIFRIFLAIFACFSLHGLQLSEWQLKNGVMSHGLVPIRTSSYHACPVAYTFLNFCRHRVAAEAKEKSLREN